VEPLLRDVRLDPGRIPDPDAFPFTLPAVNALRKPLAFHPQVTFLIGENGSGKSTILEAHGGRPLHAMSHGESFLTLVVERFYPDGLFLLDEPEAAMSPQGCLTLLRRIRELALDGAQFVIATHSPLLLAYPDASIYALGDDGIEPTDYQDTEHYRLTRAFLEAPERFLRQLFA
jgi:predicted ATPase